MRKDSGCDQRSVQIRRVFRNEHQPVEQNAEKHKDQDSAEHSQLLTDHNKDHIILSLRYNAQLLSAVSQTFPEESPASDGVKPLHNLETSVSRSRLRIQPGQNSLDTEIITVGRNDGKSRDSDHRDCRQGNQSDQKRLRLRMDHEDQNTGNRHNNDRSTQVICQHINAKGCYHSQSKHPDHAFLCVRFFPKSAQFI